MVDAHKVIVEFLLAAQAVTDLAGHRIWPGTDFPPEYKPGNGPGLLFAVRGGGQAYHSATVQPSVQFQSYAETPALAAQLDAALFDALNNQPGPGIRQVRLETLGQPLIDPETLWPFMLSGYRFWLENN